MSWRILQGDVLDRLRDIHDGSVQCCVRLPRSNTDAVEEAGHPSGLGHRVSVLLGSPCASNVPSPKRNTGALRFLLDLTKAQAVLRLRTLDPKVREYCAESRRGLPIGDLPREQRPTLLCARFADVARPTEQRREEIHRLRLNLLDADSLAVVRLSTVAVSHRVGGHLHADGSVGVDHASAVG